MGGVAGHMDHLYDNRELTFGEMKEIIRAAANAELSTEEKVDGQNLFLSYSVPEGKAKGARNKGNLKSGGLDAVGLAKKFAGRGGLEKAFVNGFDAFEKAVESLSDREKIRAFGPDANIWYNAEIMDPGTAGDPDDPGSVNVIKYDDKTLKIHGVGHFAFDKDTGEKNPIPDGALEVIDDALERMQRQLSKSESKYKLARKAIINLQRLEDEEVLSRSIAALNRQMADNNLNDDSTMEEYMFTRLLNGMDTELPENIRREIVRYLMKLPGNIGLRAIKKGLSKEDLADLNNIIASKKSLLLQAIEPLENIVHDFAVELLKGLDSVFIADTSAEVMRLKEELANAVREITARGVEDPAAMEVMQRHLNKIKDFSQITTPVEAVVFDYNGHTYKFSGNFAPLNQILGMFKYGMGTKPMTNESVQSRKNILTEDEANIKDVNKRVALFPGKFKPPHRGHFDYVNQIAKRPDVDEVIILISPVDYPEVSNQQSLKIWETYLQNGEPNITAKIADYRSPVQAVYEFVADPESAKEGDTVLLVKSSKDVGDTRFNRAQQYADKHNSGVTVDDIVEDPVQSEGGIVYSARDMRKAINDGDRETFLSYVPPSADADALWNTLTKKEESLDSLIDDAIEEMSTVAGGAGGGYSLPLGAKPVYPKANKRKSNKPKVNRGKRQRRR